MNGAAAKGATRQNGLAENSENTALVSVTPTPPDAQPISLDTATQAAIMAGHFELMQAFLAHQAQVASAFFAGQPAADPPTQSDEFCVDGGG
jgi:ankyrin repeat protein